MEDRKAKCYFCDRDVTEEQERLVLLKHIMCSRCERLLVNTTVNDAHYLLFKEKIKQIWFV